MPVLDMQLSELEKYMGSSPCPDDIDRYWSDALDEMNGVEPDLELSHATFQTDFAECFDMYFTGVRGARIYAKYLRPRNLGDEKHPVVLQFHGYTCSSGDWFDKLPYVAQGFCVASLDVRGQGGLSEDVISATGTTLGGHIVRGLDGDKHDLFFRHVYLDTAQLAKIVLAFDEADECRVGAYGGSQGGALTIACAALEPRVKVAVAQYPFLCDYKRVWVMDLAKAAYEGITFYFKHFDPQHKREDDIFYMLGYIDLQNISKNIKAHVCLGTGLMDDICPPSTQFAMYNKITSSKEMDIYPDFGHENLPDFADRTFTLLSRL